MQKKKGGSVRITDKLKEIDPQAKKDNAERKLFSPYLLSKKLKNVR